MLVELFGLFPSSALGLSSWEEAVGTAEEKPLEEMDLILHCVGYRLKAA